MKLTRRVVMVIVVGAWAACLAQADARQRGAKPAANAPRHLGERHPSGFGQGRGTASREAPVLGRNAIGLATPPTSVGSGAAARGTSAAPNTAGAAKGNAIGVRGGSGGLPATSASVGKIGPGLGPASAVHPALPTTSASGGTINGTGMTRPGFTPGVVGGPAKIATGISGTGLRPKR